MLRVFWRNIDPTVKDRQFCDIGSQYRTAIFVHDEGQRKAAEASKAALDTMMTNSTDVTINLPVLKDHGLAPRG